MRKVIGLLVILLASSAHAVKVGSIYPSGTDKTKALEMCKQVADFPDEGGVFKSQCPMMKEATRAGYSMGYIGHDHGAAFWMAFNGQEIEINEIDRSLVTHKYNLPAGYEPTWHDQGVANGVFEMRYKRQGGKRVPYAIIFRSNFQVSYTDHSGTEFKLGSVSSGLIVIKLDGANTKVIGMVDSIKAHQNGLSGNKLAQDCADTIVGQGNIAACTY